MFNLEECFFLYFRYFENPHPPREVVLDCVNRLRKQVVHSLKHKSPEQRLNLEFQYDVYDYLFAGKGKPSEQKNWTLFENKILPMLVYLRIGIVTITNMGMVLR